MSNELSRKVNDFHRDSKFHIKKQPAPVRVRAMERMNGGDYLSTTVATCDVPSAAMIWSR